MALVKIIHSGISKRLTVHIYTMPFQAARVGDLGTHGDIILNGSPNVRINGMSAARVMDIFMCPIAGIGVIISGSPNVNINGQPAARVTSLGACRGVTLIISGSPNTNVS